MEQAVKSIITQENLDVFLQVLDNMSDTTIVNCISDIADFRLSGDIDTKNTKIYFFHGTAANEMLAKNPRNSYQRITLALLCHTDTWKSMILRSFQAHGICSE